MTDKKERIISVFREGGKIVVIKRVTKKKKKESKLHKISRCNIL